MQGESSDGSVKASVNGEFRLVDIDIDGNLIDSGDKSRIQKSIISAVNSAIDNSKDFAAKEMSNLTGGMDIPGLDSFFK